MLHVSARTGATRCSLGTHARACVLHGSRDHASLQSFVQQPHHGVASPDLRQEHRAHRAVSRFALPGGPSPRWGTNTHAAPAARGSVRGGVDPWPCVRRSGGLRSSPARGAGLGACTVATHPTVHVSGGLVWLVAHSVHACIMITRHCSPLYNNQITELPVQIFAKNSKLTQMCVNGHCLAGTSAVMRGRHAWRLLCEGACVVAMRPVVRRSAFEPSAWCWAGCMHGSHAPDGARELRAGARGCSLCTHARACVLHGSRDHAPLQ